MTLVTASTFSDALTNLTAQEQKQAKITAYDLAADPKGNGIQLRRIEAAPELWTAGVSQDLRIVLHKDGEHTLTGSGTASSTTFGAMRMAHLMRSGATWFEGTACP